MITSTSATNTSNALANFTVTTPANGANSAGSTDPFTQQLAAELEQYLGKSTNGASSEIDIKISQSQVSAGRQFTVTITEPDATASAATSTATSTAKATAAAATLADAGNAMVTGVSLMDAKPRSAFELAALAAAPSADATAAPVAADKSTMTPDDAYWAEQPAPVQALRGMSAEDVGPAAFKLAQQGYTIDVPIMVWQWDPLTTMIERQQYGYTWVPSGLGAPVELPPGLSFPGLTPYDANNPPAGSIKVTTDFAKGTNMQNVFIDPATIESSWAAA